MSYTLFTASLELARALGNLRSSNTTAAGTATTIVDNTRTERNDYWNGGVLWFRTGTHAGKSRKITDWDLATTTFTFPTTTTAPGSGIVYSMINGDWPQDKLWEFINRAMRKHGPLPAIDTTLTTVAEQMEYTLPAGVYNVLRVEVATDLTAPINYQAWYNWRERGGVLYFPTGPASTGYTMRLTYMDDPAELDADDDTIDDLIHIDLLVASASVFAWEWRLQMSKEDQPMYQAFLAQAIAREAIAVRQHPIRRPIPTPRFSQ